MDTVDEGSDAFLDMIKFGNDRAYRFSTIVLEELRRTQREQSDLTRQWLDAPTDAIGLTKSALETWTRRQRRRFELTRTFFDEMAVLRDETRDAFERVTSAGREAVSVGVNSTRDAASRGGHEISYRLEDASDAVDKAARDVRKRNGK
jgi:hypothetical protein